VIVWSDYTLDGGCCGGVFARLYDATGTPQGDQFQVNTYTTGGQGMPDVAMSPGGEFVVVWAGRGEEDDGGIFGRRFGAAGVPFDGDFNINTYTTNRQSQPSVASDGEGAFVVVWSSDDQIAADLDVFGQRFDAKGVRVGDEFLVNTYTTLHQDSPQVSMDSVGNFVVVWDSSDQVDTTGVFAQHFNADGTASGSEFQLNTYTTSWQRGAGVAATAGGFVVSWEGRGQGDTTGIFGQRFLAGVTFLDGFESGDTSTWSSMVQ
jgi:hypothetical protein